MATRTNSRPSTSRSIVQAMSYQFQAVQRGKMGPFMSLFSFRTARNSTMLFSLFRDHNAPRLEYLRPHQANLIFRRLLRANHRSTQRRFGRQCAPPATDSSFEDDEALCAQLSLHPRVASTLEHAFRGQRDRLLRPPFTEFISNRLSCCRNSTHAGSSTFRL